MTHQRPDDPKCDGGWQHPARVGDLAKIWLVYRARYLCAACMKRLWLVN